MTKIKVPHISKCIGKRTLFSLGVPILYSKEIGAFEREEADRTFGMGILGTTVAGGLGLATFLSLVASVVVAFLHFMRKGNSLHLNFCFSASKLGIILRYSIVDSSTFL